MYDYNLPLTFRHLCIISSLYWKLTRQNMFYSKEPIIPYRMSMPSKHLMVMKLKLSNPGNTSRQQSQQHMQQLAEKPNIKMDDWLLASQLIYISYIYKWLMDLHYIVLVYQLVKVLATFTHSHTYSHTDGRGCHARYCSSGCSIGTNLRISISSKNTLTCRWSQESNHRPSSKWKTRSTYWITAAPCGCHAALSWNLSTILNHATPQYNKGNR